MPIPVEYKRIYKVTLFPRQVQEELVKHPDAILDDPFYLSDKECLKQDPLEYLIA